MKVTLISHTLDPIHVMACAARLCRSGSIQPKGGDTVADDAKLIKTVINMGHTSILEHASFTFFIEDVSRVLSHQLVRHRIGCSFSQVSQRHVKMENYVVPESRWNLEMEESIKRSFEDYDQLVALGVLPEDARYVLPNATSTSLVVTMNARALFHFFELRMCAKAQDEIRKLANETHKYLMAHWPGIFINSGRSCVVRNQCIGDGKMKCKE